MQHRTSIGLKGQDQDTPEVDAAERKIGGVLHELEQATDGDVKNIGLDAIVDQDEAGRPVVKKSVDVTMERSAKRGWAK